MAPPGPPPIFDPNSPFSMARQTQPSPTETVVATPRSVSPAATLASSFPSLKLDKAADSSADVLPACQEIPRVGQSDDAPHRIDGFTYLTIGGDVFRSGEKLTSVYKEKTDAKLRPISSSMLENRDDLNVTPRKAGHDQRSQFRFADSSANGSIHFEPDNLRDYSGSLWRIHTGKLSFIPSTIDRQYRKTPAILKLVWLSRFRDAPPRDWTFLEEHHTCDTARNEALNEDRTLRGLFDFQGGIVPSYYGLYTWSKANREPSKSNPPQVLAMVMEDVGPYPLERPRFSTDEM
ncbi:hypothetical protein I317_03164 [Kwoniella heveanensis CBS 569]|nr:hypothetical protein I317_03164 [Kwoniella heveanensis CBS 569]